MTTYIIRRILGMIPTWLIIMFAVVSMTRFIPGDIVDLLLSGQGGVNAAGTLAIDRAILEKRLGLDQPVQVQFANYVVGVTRGSLGNSLWDQQEVTKLIRERIPVTIEVALVAIVTSVLISIPLGVVAAVKRDTVTDYLLRSVSILGISIPGFAIGTAILIFPTIWWGIAISLRYRSFSEDPLLHLQLIIPPAIVLGTELSAGVARLVRTQMLEVLQEDYIRTARSKGVRERVVIFKHALKNALIPVVTVLAFQVSALLGGSVVTETIFNLPGLGRLLVGSIANRDYPIIQGIVVMTSVFVMITSLLVDISYGMLDPRARLHGSAR